MEVMMERIRQVEERARLAEEDRERMRLELLSTQKSALSLGARVQVKQEKLEEEAQRRECSCCLNREATVMLLPCNHLCVCLMCDGDGVLTACPLCRTLATGRIHVKGQL